MRKELIDRINELAHKKKAEGLTEAEQAEQARLRQEYLAEFRKNFRKQLDNVKFVEDLTEEELKQIAAEKQGRERAEEAEAIVEEAEEIAEAAEEIAEEAELIEKEAEEIVEKAEAIRSAVLD